MKLLQPILSYEYKLLNFYGHAGLGKTYSIRNMIHYISERKFFQGGIIYLKLDEIYQIDNLLKKMFHEAIRFFKLNQEQRNDIKD